MKKKNIGGVPGNVLGMLADLNHKLQHGVITPEHLGKFLKKQNPFEAVVDDIIADWQKAYKDDGINCDFSNLVIPTKPAKGNYRLIIMAQGITPQKAFDLCAKHFKCHKYTDKNLDEIVTSERTTQNGPYAIWVKDTVEADEYPNHSYNQLKELGIKGITLDERLILEWKFHKETNKHLDVRNWTLCSGSRYSDGGVPRVGWLGRCDGMDVYWYDSGIARVALRSRCAVI